MIHSIIFDLNGVIIANGNDVREKLAKEGFDKEKLYLATSGRSPLGRQYLTGEISLEEYTKHVARIFPHDYAYILEQYNKRRILYVKKDWIQSFLLLPFSLSIDMGTFPEILSMLDFVKECAKSYDLCLFTGSSQAHIQAIDREYDLLHYFSYKVFSYIVGDDKPSDTMFNALLKEIPYSSTECVLIDDKEMNISKARVYGLQTCLFETAILV